MKETRIKYLFYISSVILLFVMMFSSRNVGISCDEVLHYNQSVAVYDYFTSHGEDKSALNTPVTHLKYYGQSYDNFVTIIINWFNIEDIYRFRHIMSSIAGWLTIMVTAFFAIWLADFRAGILVLILFTVSPTFFGHSLNNLKDIPFALGYISSTFFILKFLLAGGRVRFSTIILLLSAIAFTLSIRAGGLIVICYFCFFFFIHYLVKGIYEGQIILFEILNKLIWINVIIIASFFLSTILWPYALQNPVKNIFDSYHVMAHFPDTFRQIFNGKLEWSDFMPWYYLPESMAITIPLIVLAGVVLFGLYSKRIFNSNNYFSLGCIVFTLLFPFVYVVYEKSNLYSSWRQFLFLYPGIVLLASLGFLHVYKYLNKKFFKWIAIVLFSLLAIHPLKYMVLNAPYYYLYYNQLVGGLEGAYMKFETDYYYTSQTEASDWLINYLKSNNISNALKVKATYSVNWNFRENHQIETSYLRYEERSQSDWDYAIVVNRYISPKQLNNNQFPPENAIHIIYADKVPVCAVLKRVTKDDYFGYMALEEDRNEDALNHFKKVFKDNCSDELIFYNFARALFNNGQYLRADSVLKQGLKINPDYEPILMYLGNIAKSLNKTDDAIGYYERVIGANRKYFEAYVGLSGLLIDKDLMRSRSLLRTCLTINPRYKPAIVALADTYRKSNPDIAKKYDELAEKLIN